MEKKEMNVLEHLDELRKRMIYTLIAFMISFVSSFIFVEDLYRWFVRNLNNKLVILGPSDILWVYMVIAGIFAITITIPVAAYQTWKFLAPGLTLEEQKLTLAFIPGVFLLFVIGISFGYFVLFPIVFTFLTTLSEMQFETMYTADNYFRFVINLTLPFGLLFEMPLVVMFLTRLGIINPVSLAKARKVAYFVLIVVSIFITPPDFVSDILVIVPLLFLYEVSISLSKIIYNKRLAEMEAL